MSIQTVAKKVGKIDVLKIFFQLVEENEELLVSMNTKQLSKGIRSDGTNIEPPYTSYTKRIKSAKGRGLGKKTSNVTLFMTGGYHKSYEVDIKGKKVFLGSDYIVDGKNLAFDLRAKYGDKIEGLTKENESIFFNKIMPELLLRIDNAFRGL